MQSSDEAMRDETREVSWAVGPTTVHGSLVRPAGPGPFPAVVLVAGSGPTDRDWNSPLLPGTNGSARLLAEALARAGIASLRYDKRASGPHVRETIAAMPAIAGSTGKFSMQSHLDELIGGVAFLASQTFVDPSRIFGLGNSEGTLHVLNYQLRDPEIPFAGLVLTGPPGRAVGAVARAQLAAQASGLPNGDGFLALYDAAIARFLAGEPVAPDPSLPVAFQQLLQGLAAPVNQPMARELWIADAASLLAQVSVPVLIIIGKKDIQVDWIADGEPLQRAAVGHDRVTFLFPENANHVLKSEPRPRSALGPADVLPSYNGPDAQLDPVTTEAIVNWLRSAA